MLIAIVLIGCQPATNKFRIPWPVVVGDTTGSRRVQYQSQVVELSTLRDPSHLRGDAAVVVINPKIDHSENGSSLNLAESKVEYLRDGDVLVPANMDSLQALTVYAHHEKLHQLDLDLGFKAFAQLPARIGVMARLATITGGVLETISSNALYVSELDALFFVPYDLGKWPLSLNAGVIAHEHFHRLFDQIFRESLPENALKVSSGRSCQLHVPEDIPEQEIPATTTLKRIPLRELAINTGIYNRVLLRALNEGLADFWGWAYSKDDNFIQISLGTDEGDRRRLDRGVVRPLITATQFKNDLVLRGSDLNRIAMAYRVGTQYSRVLREVYDRAIDGRGQTASLAIKLYFQRALIQSVRALSSSIKNFNETEIDPADWVKKFVVSLKTIPEQGANFKGFTSAEAADLCQFTASISAPSVASVCSGLK